MKHVRSAFVLAAVGVGAVLLWYTDVLAYAWEQEGAWTRGLVVATLLWAAVCFVGSFRSRRWLQYGLEVCPTFGLLGTVVAVGLELGAITDDAGVMALIGKLAIAVHATAVGITTALIIYAQKIALERDAADV